jgi:hypothetical protein
LTTLTVPDFGLLEKQLKKPPPYATGSLYSSFFMLLREAFLEPAALVYFDRSPKSSAAS